MAGEQVVNELGRTDDGGTVEAAVVQGPAHPGAERRRRRHQRRTAWVLCVIDLLMAVAVLALLVLLADGRHW